MAFEALSLIHQQCLVPALHLSFHTSFFSLLLSGKNGQQGFHGHLHHDMSQQWRLQLSKPFGTVLHSPDPMSLDAAFDNAIGQPLAGTLLDLGDQYLNDSARNGELQSVDHAAGVHLMQDSSATTWGTKKTIFHSAAHLTSPLT